MIRQVPPEYAGIIVASLVIVLVIGLVEINDVDRSGLPIQPAATAVDPVTADSAIETQQQPDCTQAESEFSANLEQSRSCIVDDDCTLTSFGCPFECVAAIGKSTLDALQREEGSFQNVCQRCVSSCPPVLDKWRAACVRQRCIVLDRSIDELEEETLRLINE